METEPVRLRRAGRVIVLDPDDRVLLFRYDDGPPNGQHWCTPGGGLNDGEDYAAGARRELAEETGWTDVVLGAEVFERTLTMEYTDEIVRQHERFFLARVASARRGLGEVAAMHVSDGIAAWRWWTRPRDRPRRSHLRAGPAGVPAGKAVFVDDQPSYCAGAEALGITAVQIARGELAGRGRHGRPLAGGRRGHVLMLTAWAAARRPGRAPR